MLSIGGHEVAAMGISASALRFASEPLAVTTQGGVVVLNVNGQASAGTLELTEPPQYAGTYEVDWTTGLVTLVPPRWEGRPAYRRVLQYHCGLRLHPVGSAPEVTLNLNGGRQLVDKAYEVQAGDRGEQITMTETVQGPGYQSSETASVQVPFVAGLDDDTGLLLRYDQAGVTPSKWLSYVNPADDLTGPVNGAAPAQFTDFERVTMGTGQSLGLPDRSLVSPGFAAGGHLHMYIVLRLDETAPDGTNTILSESAGPLWSDYLDLGLIVSGGQASVRMRSRKSYDYGLQLQGGNVPLGQKVLIEVHVTPAGAELLVNGVAVDTASVQVSKLYDGSGGKFVLGMNDQGELVRKAFEGQMQHIHATTTAPSGSGVRAYLIAEHGVEV